MIIETNNLVKIYNERHVVDGVSISVEQGSIVGLLGPNGAGKTTTFYMIVGIERPDAGVVTLDGKDISNMPMYERARAGIGYLPQEASIFSKMTVEDNIMAILETTDMDAEAREQKMNDLIEEIVGDFAEEDDKNEPIFEKIDEKTWRMSGSIPLDVITDELGIELPNDEFDTLGGLIMSTQTSVPDDGTQFECEAYGLHIDVIKVNDHLIEEAIVTLKQVKDNTQVDVSETDKD